MKNTAAKAKADFSAHTHLYGRSGLGSYTHTAHNCTLTGRAGGDFWGLEHAQGTANGKGSGDKRHVLADFAGGA